MLHSSSWIFLALLVMIPTMTLSVLVLLFVRKAVPVEVLRKNHDVAGFTFSIVGVLYSVVLGFTVVSSQERYNNIEKNILVEVFTIADLYRDSSFFPRKTGNAIREALRDYVDYVIHTEWWLPAEKQVEFKSQEIKTRLWKIYRGVAVEDPKMEIWYSDVVSKLSSFMDASLARQFSSLDKLNPMMWTLLIVGGFITICFMFFFGLENLRSQMLMTALLAGYLAFMLFLVYSLDHVFRGPAGIQPTALEQIEPLFDRWDEELLNTNYGDKVRS